MDDGGEVPMTATSIPVMMGRKFVVDGVGYYKQNRNSSICWIDFKRLCEDDVGAADYQV